MVGVIQSGRFGGWTPLALSPALWLDASDAATITLDGSSKVSAWADKSGNSRNFSQATSGNRPTYADTQNGRSVVTFNGSAWLTASTWGPSTTAITIAGVAANSSRVYFSLGSNNHMGISNDGDSGLFGGLLGGVAWLGGSGATTSMALNVVRRSGGTNTVRKNAADVTVTGGGSSTPSAASGSMWVGGDSVGKITGKVCEVIVVNGSAVSGADLTALEAYLNAKWAVY